MPVSFNLSGEIAEAALVSALAASKVDATVPSGMGSVMVKSVAAAGTKIWVRNADSGSQPTRASVIATTPDMVNTSAAVNVLDVPRLLKGVLSIYTDTDQTVELYYYHGRVVDSAPNSLATNFARVVLPTIKAVA